MNQASLVTCQCVCASMRPYKINAFFYLCVPYGNC